MDYLIRGERLPGAGETLEGDAFDESPGGKGANQAVAAGRLGGRVAFVARIGTDPRGDSVLERLAEEGVDRRHVHRDPEVGTGVAIVMVDRSGAKQIFAAPRANARLSREDVTAAAGALTSCRVLLLQLEVPLEAVTEAVRLAKEAGAFVVLDPAPARPLPDSLLAQLDVIRPNAHEAAVLTGVEVHDFATARRAADVLVRRGVRAAVVGAGGDGDLLLSEGHEVRLPRFEVKSVDATGAGDAFAAALAVALAWGLSWGDAARFGSAAAALKTTRLGAQAGLPKRAAVQDFLAERNISLPLP
jgi:ribokinase